MDVKKLNAYKQLIEENIESFDLIRTDRSKIDDINNEIQDLSEFGLKGIGMLAGHKNKFYKDKLDRHISKLKSEGRSVLNELQEIENEILKKVKEYSKLDGKEKENLEEELQLLLLKKHDLISKTNSNRFNLSKHTEELYTEYKNEKIELVKIYEKIQNAGGEVKLYSFFVGLFFAFLSFLTENILIGEFQSQNLNWANYTGFLINFVIGIVTYEIAKTRIEDFLLKKHISQAKNIIANLYKREKDRTKKITKVLESNLK